MEETGLEVSNQSPLFVGSDSRGPSVNLFADSSALAKRYIFDEKSHDFDELLQRTTNLAVSVLCLPEIVSALCRRRRERVLKPAEYAAAKNALDVDLADAAIVQIVDEVLLGAIRLLETHPLRSSDAIQISSALAWQADVFVSADARQCSAAKASGLGVINL